MSAKRNDKRLPPPAFPPGSRRHVRRNSAHPHAEDGPLAEREAGPFISPDDPMPARRDAVQRAFISPDEPLPDREMGGGERSRDATDSPVLPDALLATARGTTGEEEGVASGLGASAPLAGGEQNVTLDPHVAEVVDAVGKLAESVRRRGEAGLRANPGMSRFEATLRAYCVGYLAGRRAESEPTEA